VPCVEGRSSTAATLQTLLAKLLILATNLATGVITARSSSSRGEQAAMILWPQFCLHYDARPTQRVISSYYPEKESELFSAALLLSTALGYSNTGRFICVVGSSAEVIYIASGL